MRMNYKCLSLFGGYGYVVVLFCVLTSSCPEQSPEINKVLFNFIHVSGFPVLAAIYGKSENNLIVGKAVGTLHIFKKRVSHVI